MAKMRRSVHRRTTQIDADRARVSQRERFHRLSGGVIEVQHGEKPTICLLCPQCLRSHLSTISRQSGHPDGKPTGSIASTRQPRVPMCSPSTLHPPRSVVLCTWVMCSRTRTPTPSRDSGACVGSTCSIRWDGTTTAFRLNVACRISSACRLTRQFPTRRTSSHLSAAILRKITKQYPCRDRTSSNCVKNSPHKTRRCSKTCSAGSACLSIGGISTRRLTIAPGALASVHSCAT